MRYEPRASTRRLSRAGIGRALFRVLLYALLVLPLGGLVLYALSTRWFYPQVLPNTWTLEPLQRQLANPVTRDALGVSIEIALLVSTLSVLISYPAARALGTRTFRGKGLVTLLLFLPTVVPPVAMGMGLNILFLRVGLAGTLPGVMLVHLIPVLPYTLFGLIGVFARYDPNYEYQALVLGAGHARIFLNVTVPLVLPGVAVAALFGFLVSWSQYLLTLLIGGGQIITLPLLLFATVAGGNPTTIAILSLLFVAPPIIVIALTARYLTAAEIDERRGQY